MADGPEPAANGGAADAEEAAEPSDELAGGLDLTSGAKGGGVAASGDDLALNTRPPDEAEPPADEPQEEEPAEEDANDDGADTEVAATSPARRGSTRPRLEMLAPTKREEVIRRYRAARQRLTAEEKQAVEEYYRFLRDIR